MSLDLRLPGCILPSVLFLTAASLLHAQDARTVKEPSVPPVCTTLSASLTAGDATSGRIEAQAVKSGSDKTGLDTARLQAAIDGCEPGHAVELTAQGSKDAFLIGPIALHAHVTLLLDRGITVYASRNPESYAQTPGSCGIVSDSPSGCKPLISVRSASGAAIMGEGAIDGQGGSPLIQDGNAGQQSWWDLAENAPRGGYAASPRLIDVDLSDSFTVYQVALRNSPNWNLSFHRGEGLTVWGIRIDTPESARNTVGIFTEQARDVTVTHSAIRTGEAAITMNAGDGPTTGITLTDDRLYWGRGIVIGPATLSGVSEVRVNNVSLDGSEMGLVIRSDAGQGGLVDDVAYNNVCMRNSRMPISFNSVFAFPGRAAAAIPVYQQITLHNVQISGGGRIQFNGFDATHRIGATLDGVLLLDRAGYSPEATHTDFTFGPGPVNLVFTGDDSTISGKAGKASLPGCAAMFVPFPQ